MPAYCPITYLSGLMLVGNIILIGGFNLCVENKHLEATLENYEYKKKKKKSFYEQSSTALLHISRVMRSLGTHFSCHGSTSTALLHINQGHASARVGPSRLPLHTCFVT